MTGLNYKGYHLGVWALCVVGLYLLLEAIERMMFRTARTWGDHGR